MLRRKPPYLHMLRANPENGNGVVFAALRRDAKGSELYASASDPLFHLLLREHISSESLSDTQKKEKVHQESL